MIVSSKLSLIGPNMNIERKSTRTKIKQKWSLLLNFAGLEILREHYSFEIICSRSIKKQQPQNLLHLLPSQRIELMSVNLIFTEKLLPKAIKYQTMKPIE